VFRKPDGQVECVPFSEGWDADRIKSALRERNLVREQLLEVFLGEDETPDSMEVRTILTDALGGNFTVPAHYGEPGDPVERRVELTLAITRNYLRAIAKVAFHYFLWTSTTCRGDEPQFARLRRFIRNDEGDWHTFVQLVSPQFLPQLAAGLTPTIPSHFLFAELNHEEVLARVQFFVAPGSRTPPSLVHIGRSPARIYARWLSAHWVRYFPERTEGFDGEIERIDVTERRIAVRRHV
jgi:hypothetical protein